MSDNKLLNFVLMFFLKNFAIGSMRLNKNQSFHFKERSFLPLQLQRKAPRSLLF